MIDIDYKNISVGDLVQVRTHVYQDELLECIIVGVGGHDIASWAGSHPPWEEFVPTWREQRYYQAYFCSLGKMLPIFEQEIEVVLSRARRYNTNEL